MKQFVISAREAGQRMDKYLFKVLNLAPHGFVYKMLRKKNIVLNEKKASGAEILRAQDIIKIYLSDETFAKFASLLPECDEKRQTKPSNFGTNKDTNLLPIIYEDEDILVIDKPAGMLSQKAQPEDISANEYMIEYLLQSGQLKEAELRTFRPSICNRLDRNTSGLLIAGKTMHGLQEMAKLLKTRTVKKFYRTLVVGELSKPQHLTGYLIKNDRTNQVEIHSNGKGEFIETFYVPIKRLNGGTLLEVHLITGRSHQIRAHLSSIGHPVLGDPKYGNKKINVKLQKETGIRRQLLHAYRMEFPDGKVLTAEVPADFQAAERWLAG